MTEHADLLSSIAYTIKDYRAGELPKPTPEHVERWISQFDNAVQLPMLREMDHVLKATYFSKTSVRKFFAKQIRHEALAGKNPCDFWHSAHLLDIQKAGHSQHEIRALFLKALVAKCGSTIGGVGSDGGAYIYLDDVLFSGDRVGNDLADWIKNQAPQNATVHILVIAAHRYGEWRSLNGPNGLKARAAQLGKQITFDLWAALRLENRRYHRNRSEVLWPATLPDDQTLKEYMDQEDKFPFECRTAGITPEFPVFSSEQGRQLLERELLLAGLRIRSFSQHPDPKMRPLGRSPFGLGFGSMIVTYRNCPNNTPLALWWGDPHSPASHPFSRWCPLFPRKTYAHVDYADDIPF